MTSCIGTIAVGAVDAHAMPIAEDITQSNGSPTTFETWQYPQLSAACINTDTRSSNNPRFPSGAQVANDTRILTTGSLLAKDLRASSDFLTVLLILFVIDRNVAIDAFAAVASPPPDSIKKEIH